jgi:hypothetical protein
MQSQVGGWNSSGPQWKSIDGAPAVFKTVGGALRGVLGGFNSHPSRQMSALTAAAADVNALWRTSLDNLAFSVRSRAYLSL